MPTTTIFTPDKKWQHGLIFNAADHEKVGNVLIVKREHNGEAYPPFIYFKDEYNKMKCKYLEGTSIPIEAFSQWDDNHHFYWVIYTRTEWAIKTLTLI